MSDTIRNIWRTQEIDDKKKEPTGEVRIGLAVAALVFGVVSVALAVLVTGAVFGIVGLILGIICLSGRNQGKTMAGWGIGLSVAGILISSIFGMIWAAAIIQSEADMNNYDDYDPNEYETVLNDEWAGKPAPDFSITGTEGQTIRLSEFRGRRVVLNFWDPGELRCRDALPHFIQIRESISEDELVIIGIVDTGEEEARDVGKKLGINYPLAHREELPEPFDVYIWEPVTFFIDESGIIQSVLEDYHSFTELKKRAEGSDYSIFPEPNEQHIIIK